METLINDKFDEYYNETYGNKVDLYYLYSNITYLKTQYKLLTADKHVLFTLLYRQLCQCYKKKINMNRLLWYRHGRYKHHYICNVGCLFIVNTKNITLLPMIYYDIIYLLFSDSEW